MPGFMDFLTPISTAVGAYQQGARAKQERDAEDMLKLLQLRRQQQLDADNAAIHAAQLGEYKAKDAERQRDALARRTFYDRIKRDFATNDYALGDFDPGTPYETIYPELQKTKLADAEKAKERARGWKALGMMFPNDERFKGPAPEDVNVEDVRQILEKGPVPGSEEYYRMKGKEADIVSAHQPSNYTYLGQDAQGNIVTMNTRTGKSGTQEGVFRPAGSGGGRGGQTVLLKRAEGLLNAESALKAYKDALTKYGSIVSPTNADVAELSSKYNTFIQMWKEVPGLGALQKAEIDLIQRQMVDPTSIKARALSGFLPTLQTKKALRGIDALGAMLNDAKANFNTAQQISGVGGGGGLAGSRAAAAGAGAGGGGGGFNLAPRANPNFRKLTPAQLRLLLQHSTREDIEANYGPQDWP